MKFFFGASLISLFSMLVASTVHANEQPDKPADSSVYELRVYMGYRFLPPEALKSEPGIQTDALKPQIDTLIKLDKYFFAKATLPASTGKEQGKDTLYIASGVLHPAKSGKFSLERTFMWAGDRGSGMTFGPGTIELELDKPTVLAVSLGRVRGYTAILSKVPSTAEPTSN